MRFTSIGRKEQNFIRKIFFLKEIKIIPKSANYIESRSESIGKDLCCEVEAPPFIKWIKTDFTERWCGYEFIV